MPDCALCRRHVDPAGFPTAPVRPRHQGLDGTVLRRIAHLRRRRMRVDVVHLCGLGARMPQRHLHRAQRAAPARQRRGQMMRIRARAIANELGVDVGAAVAGVVELLEDHDARALADDEAVAGLVEGAGGSGGVVVEGDGQAAGASEAADGERVDAGFGATG